MREILLTFPLWQAYTRFCIYWRDRQGAPVDLDVGGCGVTVPELHALAQRGAVESAGPGLWRLAPGVRVLSMPPDPAQKVVNPRRNSKMRALRITNALDEAIAAAADNQGITFSEWLRGAAIQKLGAYSHNGEGGRGMNANIAACVAAALVLGLAGLAGWMIALGYPWASVPFFLMALSVRVSGGRK